MAYRYAKRKNHPLSPPSGSLPLHRLVLFDKIGPGAHPCHHCGVMVEWRVGVRTAEGALISEHLDGNPANNAPDNLAPSCHACNIRKSKHGVSDQEEFIKINGNRTRARAVRKVCVVCGKEFLVRAAIVKSKSPKSGDGKYCSRQCMYDRGKR